LDRQKLKQLLKSEEGPKLDFKEALHLVNESDKKELTKDVIAIANSRGGRGYIIFGIQDKTKNIIGITASDFQEEQIQQIIYNRCDPPVPISIDFIDCENKIIAVLTVYRSNHKPHMMLQNGAFYVRRGSTTDVARRGEIANLFQENGILTYETVILKNAKLEELDYDLISRYFNSLDIISGKPNEILMEAMGMIGQKGELEGYRATIGGMLLFGKNPSLYLPHVYVKITYKEEIEFITGNIVKMLDAACAKIRELITDNDYPFQALEEVLANALVHRDYLDASRGVVVAVSDKNIEISNPGSLIASNSIYKFEHENNPDRRNSWLYQRLVTADSKRFLKTGAGLSRVKKAFEGIGDVKFLNIGSQNLFKVILPRIKLIKVN
jgi:Predicted transcriptional regulator containing an HTH domain and an uncharacterized domain shared with the mammalian protein Schlafen